MVGEPSGGCTGGTELMQEPDRHRVVTDLLQQWHTEAGLIPTRLAGPAASPLGLLAIVVDGRDCETSQVCLTVSSLLQGTVQRARIQILLSESADSRLIGEWIAHEHQVSLINALQEVLPGEEYLMVIQAGVIVGAYSVEAAVACLDTADAAVLRVVIDGVERAAELWRSDALGDSGERFDAELRARAAGSERWVSGASTGMHAAGRPAPKMFLRKGVAEKFEVRVVVRDTAKTDVKADYESRLRDLELQLARAKRNAANHAGSITGGAGVLRAVKKGPGYIARRAAQLLRQRLMERN